MLLHNQKEIYQVCESRAVIFSDMSTQLEWIEWGLLCVGTFGTFIGAFSLLAPKRSIELYQWIMRNFNWRVEPIDYKRELRNTRVLGLWLFVTSVLMFLALVKPEWVLFDGLRAST